MYQTKAFTVCLLINKQLDLNYRMDLLSEPVENETTYFIEIEIEKESSILKIEISWDRYNLERVATLSNQRNYH